MNEILAASIIACQEERWADALAGQWELAIGPGLPVADPAELYLMASLVLRACEDRGVASHLAHALATLGSRILAAVGPMPISQGGAADPVFGTREDEAAARWLNRG